jgi:threonine 3-dehydrogenase
MVEVVPKTMKAIIKPEAGPGLVLTEVPVPQVGRHEALVKIKATSICGTDLHIYKWDPWARGRIRPPIIVGHEFCGTVVQVGDDVNGVSVGDYVSADSHVVCHRCLQCRTGREHICQNTQIVGVDRDGCWAEYIVLPASGLWVNPPNLPPEIASLQDNFGNAVHTALATNLSNRYVLVTGCGPVGLMAIAVAKAAGARRVFATDISPYRLALARRMGADRAYNVAEVDVVAEIKRETEGNGVDVLLEMSGAASAIDQGFSALAYGGEAALLGLTSAPIPFDLNNHIIFKGATVHGIVGRKLWETWYQMRSLLSSGAVDLAPLVTHRFPMERFLDALEVMQSGHSGKVVLFPDPTDMTATL